MEHPMSNTDTTSFLNGQPVPQPQPLPDDDQTAFPAQPAPDIKKTFTPEPLDI